MTKTAYIESAKLLLPQYHDAVDLGDLENE